MSYNSAPYSSPITLLDAFVTFLGTAGWTQDAYVADGTGWRYHGHKGTKYIHLRSFINEYQGQLGNGVGSGISIIGSTGYVGGTAGFWYVQPGIPISFGLGSNTAMTRVMSLPPGAISNSWMFADTAGDNVVMVATNGSGAYTYVFFGDLVKAQAWTGGAYFGGTRAASNVIGGILASESGPPGCTGMLQATVDSFAGQWLDIDGMQSGKRLQSSTCAVSEGTVVLTDHIGYGALRLRANSGSTGALILLPTLWLVERDFAGARSGGGWSLAGQVPNVFQTTSVGFAPGALASIGTDNYIVFPEFAIRKWP